MLIETAREFMQAKCCYLSWNLAWTISSVVGEWWFLVTRNWISNLSKKSVSDIRAFPQAGLAGQRQLLASMGVLNARLRAGTQTKVGVLLSCWSCELLFKLYFINKHLPDFLERWSLPCVTFQRTRDRRRPWSPAGIHGVPLGADGSAVSYLHWLRCAWVHCWAEAL